jgi:hypothetical protein
MRELSPEAEDKYKEPGYKWDQSFSSHLFSTTGLVFLRYRQLCFRSWHGSWRFARAIKLRKGKGPFAFHSLRRVSGLSE